MMPGLVLEMQEGQDLEVHLARILDIGRTKFLRRRGTIAPRIRLLVLYAVRYYRQTRIGCLPEI